jgi:hypothetical protein
VGKNIGADGKAKPKAVAARDEGDRDGRHKNKHKKNKHGKHSRCDEPHPGRGHAYGKYKDCE